VATAGIDAQLAQARTVLTQARRALYRILAEDDEAASPAGPVTTDDGDRDETSDDN